MILGLAPGAHGANRTGRVFTGDSSGDLLYRVLHATGFASQASSTSREDGLTLTGAYITAAYWFTSSTSFANPAVTLARSLSDTFAGIRPSDVPGFVVAQLLGAACATLLFWWLMPLRLKDAPAVIVPHQESRESSDD